MPAEEATLLMHFLDNMFPVMYPMYRPGVLEGGRGWLLPIILRIKPLYHAALAFGAYYRAATLSATNPSSRVAALVEQGKLYEICIKSLNQFGEGSCPYAKLGIVTTVAQLIFYEVYRRSNRFHISTDFLCSYLLALVIHGNLIFMQQ
jgi:hypothetical protein